MDKRFYTVQRERGYKDGDPTLATTRNTIIILNSCVISYLSRARVKKTPSISGTEKIESQLRRNRINIISLAWYSNLWTHESVNVWFILRLVRCSSSETILFRPAGWNDYIYLEPHATIRPPTRCALLPVVVKAWKRKK